MGNIVHHEPLDIKKIDFNEYNMVAIFDPAFDEAKNNLAKYMAIKIKGGASYEDLAPIRKYLGSLYEWSFVGYKLVKKIASEVNGE